MGYKRDQLKRLLTQMEGRIQPETIQLMRWLDTLQKHSMPKYAPTIGGLWYRQNVANIDDLNTAAAFYNLFENVTPFRNLHTMRIALDKCETDDLLAKFILLADKFVLVFLQRYEAHQLPFHPHQQFYFRINPTGQWSNSSIAVYHQQVRVGYLRGYDAGEFLNRFSKKQITNSIGYVVRSNEGNYVGTRIRLMIPQKAQLENGYQIAVPEMIEWEKEHPSTLIHYPLPAALQAKRIQL